ncbi:MAG: hypothetical protein SFY70_09440 [Bacteroidia bacterium]|nr:hypothetical protein [Bacteroidia bacterium]
MRPLRGAYVRLNFDTGDNDGGGLLDSTGQLTLSLKERTTVRNSGAIVDSQLATLQFPIDTTRVPPEVRARILAASKKMVYTYEHSDTLVQRGRLLELVIDSTTVTEVRLDTTRAQHQVRLYWPTDVAYTRKSDFRLEPSTGTKGALRLRIRRRGGGWRAVELYPHPQITGYPAACR